jgi:hypothetical protein
MTIVVQLLTNYLRDIQQRRQIETRYTKCRLNTEEGREGNRRSQLRRKEKKISLEVGVGYQQQSRPCKKATHTCTSGDGSVGF